MKDVIEEQRLYLLEKLVNAGHGWNVRSLIDESFLKIANEADFIINRLQGEAGLIERAAEKMPRVTELLKAQAKIMRGYAARVENSEAPEFQQKRIIRPTDFHGL